MTAPDPGPPPTLLTNHQHRFAPMRRQRGTTLATKGAAKVTHVSALEISGVVVDRAPHACFLTFAAHDKLETSCTCRGPQFCEHAFALLLVEDGRRAGETAAATRTAPLPEASTARTTSTKTTSRRAAKAKTKEPAKASKEPNAPPLPPAWRDRLRTIHSQSARRADPEQTVPLTFRLDVEQSRRLRALVFEILAPRDGKVGNPLQRIGRSLKRDRLTDVTNRVLRCLKALEHGFAFLDVPEAQQEVHEPWASRLLPDLFAAGAFVWFERDADGGTLLHPLHYDDGPAYALHTDLERTQPQLRLRATLRRGDDVLQPNDILLLLEGHALLRDRFVRTAIDEPARVLAGDLLQHGALAVPSEHEADLITHLADIAKEVPELGVSIAVVEAGDPEPVFELDTTRAMGQFFLGELRLAYGDTVIDLDAPAVMAPTAAGGAMRRRDQGREQRAEQRLTATAGPDLAPTQMPGHYLVPKARTAAVISRIVAAGIRLLVNRLPMRQSLGSRLSVRTDIDWFEVRGELRFEGGSELPLASALAALKRGERVVALSDGSQGLLPEAWLEQWRQVAQFGEAHQNGVRLRRSQALLFDALLAARAGSEVDVDHGFRQLRTRLTEFQGIAAHAAPAGFTGTLRPYQETGLGWLHFLRNLQLGGCLADDMGLGKTVQVLALLLEVHTAKPDRPSLLVVPRSLLDNWRREAERFAPSLRVFDFHGATRWERLQDAGGFAAFDLVVTTYGTARIDVPRFEQQQTSWEYAILDEAQAIENETSLTSKSVRLLRARHRLALTGTPVQNHVGELWALFEFLNPGLLGKSSAFQQLLRSGDDRSEGLDLQLLHRALAPFLLRRTKADVLPDLPEKQEQEILCEMEGSQQQTYAALREHYQKLLLHGESQLGPQERFVALEALLRLRQAACHEGLIDEAKRDRESAKLEALLPMLREIVESGHKALVFSQFTSFLALVRSRLDAIGLRYEYLDGASTKRQAKVDRFQQDAQCPLFLISLKAGGFGLNLTAADYVFLLDPWWNPAAETQAADRAHRIGQTQKVTVYRLITKGTVEEKVVQLQAKKKQLVDAVLGADKSLLAAMTRDDLAALLG